MYCLIMIWYFYVGSDIVAGICVTAVLFVMSVTCKVISMKSLKEEICLIFLFAGFM